ncbi:MarR family winged helix-turn-helix transcriptional regulator [Kitasatospora sp. NPDC059795]|uniref:MarR family winged helix-turn-helix transcriptional regulator n=1 Tax=Kitasatospora sp. NPDC059795 TaxID=3346949 RepID=UPI003664D9DE
MEDAVAGVLRQWHQAYPDLDPEPIAVLGRINRIAALLQQGRTGPLPHEGLTRSEFDILGALRRTDRELTPSQLARETFASGAAVTKRLRQLEDRGLVARRADDRDRRVSHLSLTTAGTELVDRVYPDLLAYDRTLLSGLTSGEREDLSRDLGRLLLVLEGSSGRTQL